MAGGDGVEHVADVDARHRARRAAQRSVLRARKGDHRPVQAVLDPAGHQADDALVPALVEQTHARAPRRPHSAKRTRGGELDRLRLHALLDLAPLLVEPRELRGERRAPAPARPRAGRRCPTLMSVSRPAAFSRGATTKPRSAARQPLEACARPIRAMRGCRARSDRRGSAASPARPAPGCCDRAAPGRPRCRAPPDPEDPRAGTPASPQRPRERRHDVEGDADARQRRARERRSREVRIDDGVGATAARRPADGDR